ncbi:MAG: hypothetical protein KBC64_00815 [Simkaniaceae bacterium]|nr:hypothetical protein [Simkaniaceae bacterium]
MLNVNFSLSDTCVINPICNIVQNRTSFFETEIVTRIIGIALSVFAAIDMVFHLSVGITKGSLLLCRRVFHLPPPTWTVNEIHRHFAKSIVGAIGVLFGSLMGIINPRIFTYSRGGARRHTPPFPPVNPAGTQLPQPVLPQPNPVGPPPAPLGSLQQAVQDVQAGVEQAPFPRLRAAWAASSLDDKRWFVDLFNQGTDDISREVRENMANIVYRPIKPSLAGHSVNWIAPQEVDQRMNEVWARANAQQHAFFFHATRTRASLQGILQSGHVEVRHQQAFRGAFVSTVPETFFGQYIFAFKKNIEWLSPLTHGIANTSVPAGGGISVHPYWAGFSENIPVTDETLAYIAIHGTEDERQTLEAECLQWTGRAIEVRRLDDVHNELELVHNNFNLGIPREWAS